MACNLLLLLPAVVYGFLGWVVYLLLARPQRFAELFLQRPYRSWGIRFTVEDPAKFARRCRMTGLLVGVFGIVHASIVFWAILSTKR